MPTDLTPELRSAIDRFTALDRVPTVFGLDVEATATAAAEAS